MDDDARTAKAARMTQAILDYFDACNRADVEGVASFFTEDGIHYFPPGMYEGPFRGGRTIGEKWAWAVHNLGSHWTVDEVICDPETDRAVIEWTHEKRAQGVVLRGDEWYRFEPERGCSSRSGPTTRRRRTRRLDRLELGGFPYGDRGYAAS